MTDGAAEVVADPVRAETLSPWERRIAKLLLGPRAEWNPDVAMRYLPIVAWLKRTGFEGPIVDIGSGPTGIVPYLGETVIGVDPYIAHGAGPGVIPLRASCVRLPFADASCPTVLTVDMLEHVPPEDRPATISELVRITGRTLIIAVPSGRDAEDHDRRMAAAYRARRGVEFIYLSEHVEYGLPDDDDLRRWVFHSLAEHSRSATVTAAPNANLAVREWVMRRWIARTPLDSLIWVVLIWASRLLARLNRRPAYRTIVRVDFNRVHAGR